ncbi:class I SAM-dependent rRNA methyltransferase [Candidatus Magnetobacterium casense]|uniref:Class I SAM-dependent rRNA methyltransferase n=1 Tax=Candidatus Magnetobacterium casense TaxID=1455061 RepID=A0ABS6S2P2_9BACT|nr:class I SAM-dependent rRNA methyltransferase [Candidatus Magnetobacterium casensis]MBV6342907.1 class I SAM-dependent rRNA methyltransferase [Candidatus Magnetobacterium casensis]
MDRVVLRRTSRLNEGHLWVFSNELQGSPRGYAPGAIVELYDRQDNFLAVGYINPHSLISVRILSRKREEIDADFLRRRIIKAVEYRKRFLPGKDSCRMIYSEGDLLPGLIVDKYNDVIVVQTLTYGMERLKDTVLSLLDDILGPSAIVLRNDTAIRQLEGLPLERQLLKGTLDNLPVITEGGLRFEVDPMSGQKTGFFLDQAQNREAFARLIEPGGRGLDLFSYTGAWALAAASARAGVTMVDTSEKALQMASKNALLNNLQHRCDFLQDDVFDFLKRQVQDGNLYDFIVSDPPAFVKSRTNIRDGLRGYAELNALAMKALKSGGLLATSSCSYHVTRGMFMDMLTHCAIGRDVCILDIRCQGIDHPGLLAVPETQYLKCVFVQVI